MLGIAGVEALAQAVAPLPITFAIYASSCVPASRFERSGADLDAGDIAEMIERCGALVARSLQVPLADGGHTHTSELLRYDHAYPDPRGASGIDELVVAGVHAAVVTPEREIGRGWFSWRWLFEEGLVDRLVSEGRLERIEPALVTAPASG